MSRYFVDRPIFAWVIALFISVAGVIAITQLPVAQYPSVAPPSITISANYPGASAALVEETVVSIVEDEMNGIDNLIYMESMSQSNGTAQIKLTFEPGTDPSLAQVDAQNRLARAEPRLPQPVTQQGIAVEKTNENILIVVALKSLDNSYDRFELGDYASRNVIPELLRVEGVGLINLYGSERAMRVWLDMEKLLGYDLTPADVSEAIAAQNSQVSSGGIGDLPNEKGQTITATVVVKGQLSDPEAFRNIILRSNADGSVVRLEDVARVELGAQSYAVSARLGDDPIVGIAIQPAPDSNAVETAGLVRDKIEELSRYFPDGVGYDIPVDSSVFISISIEKVVQTLFEAVLLVFAVMFLFLQNLRYTLIPTIVVPVALLGTFAVLFAMGFSINVLTLFAMVLVIGILVDDAIVVVENVERLMAQENLSPRQATLKAMRQITGAILGITVVLVSVFVPMAFFPGSVGNIYRQFSATMSVSILFSAFLALTLTPALCATLLKPVDNEGEDNQARFFRWFNRWFNRSARSYQNAVDGILKRTGRFMVVYLVIAAAVGILMIRLPTAFLPEEDQGRIFTVIQLAPGATAARSSEVARRVQAYYQKQPEVEKTFAIVGVNFFGSGQNLVNIFTNLKPWSEREGEAHSAQTLAARASRDLADIRQAVIFTINPPAIPSLGTGSGFSLRLQDRGALGHEALTRAGDRLLELAADNPVIAGLRRESLSDAPQLEVGIDRDKAYAHGVDFADINAVLSMALGSRYVNDFPNRGRMQRVIIQARATQRMQPEDILEFQVRNDRGEMVSLSSFAEVSWRNGPVQLVRYNAYPALRIAGNAAPGRSTGEAMAEVEKLIDQLPAQIGYEWTGVSREEKISGAQMPLLMALSLLAVFLSLAALYESWSIPFAVMLVVPLGILGSVVGANLLGMANDVYFKVGLITIIGLSAKNAILIIEFARSLQEQGRGLLDATVTACRLRFRPIIMTSMAFIFGVMPLALSTGAGSASQRAVGTGVLGGMISATLLAIFLVPVFFVVVRRLSRAGRLRREGFNR